MSTIRDIQKAAAGLSGEEQKKLLRVIPVSEGDMPKPRIFSEAEIQNWLAEDEESMRQMGEVT